MSAASPFHAPSSLPRCHALLPCAGTGSRAGAPLPKQYQPIAGRPLVQHTLAALRGVTRLDRIVVVLAPDDAHWPGDVDGVLALRRGGATRAETVFNGLQALREAGVPDADWVLVHDAARCLVTPEEVTALIEACASDPVGGLLALPLPDTLKDEVDGRVARTIERRHKWLAQTPQMFRLGELLDALLMARATGFEGITDEASAIERTGRRPRLVEGRASNIKVTYPYDFALAEAILRSRT
ncbi:MULTISPECIES: 2-C-methyl-D-erythritol 4-phosphate cytidylyltransferase [unclassified Hydrogenophaga]|uniref:2-C-methyl-D-erythritol 4-phosphate cytidylyltransferase n=1 Tax=unclassified Hydrogenophaga TaxID=2610897 RepID=UPI00087853CE|nr:MULTISPECIES: 2-C-methyl-D-erythritol 4-phosphate cytidylyltransferase [unclassified Hydrogenophaga]MBN9371569.1 2-C-methyl-D-erythritol 4-phosphate cytidylyltransferase [Hydrogenophaga sp.]OJV55746.1 MAG: 2-C-methyl-D-erythritol 4-phosphate cytidylyltransferase [Hydrogenophaga sp. 70-12]